MIARSTSSASTIDATPMREDTMDVQVTVSNSDAPNLRPTQSIHSTRPEMYFGIPCALVKLME